MWIKTNASHIDDITLICYVTPTILYCSLGVLVQETDRDEDGLGDVDMLVVAGVL